MTMMMILVFTPSVFGLSSPLKSSLSYEHGLPLMVALGVSRLFGSCISPSAHASRRNFNLDENFLHTTLFIIIIHPTLSSRFAHIYPFGCFHLLISLHHIFFRLLLYHYDTNLFLVLLIHSFLPML